MFRSFPSSARKRSKSRASPPLPACGRVPRKQRQFEHFDGALLRAMRAAEPKQRMLQQRQQRRRLQPLGHGFGGEAGENSCRCVHQRVAAGIVEFEIPAGRAPPSPAAPARDPASPARPICPDAAPRASPPQSPAPPFPDWALRPPRGWSCRLRSSRRHPAAPAGHAIVRSRWKAASSPTPARRAHVAPACPGFRRRFA